MCAFSYNGCNLILNNEHWKIKRYTVQGHTAGTSTLSYDRHPNNTLCEKYAVDVDLTAYFIDGCEAAFDYPGEWVVDGETTLHANPAQLQAALPRAPDVEHVLLVCVEEFFDVGGDATSGTARNDSETILSARPPRRRSVGRRRCRPSRSGEKPPSRS